MSPEQFKKEVSFIDFFNDLTMFKIEEEMQKPIPQTEAK